MKTHDYVFKKIDPVSGSNPMGRHGHRAVIINNLIVVLFGGKNEILNDLNVFDINTNQWFIPPICGDPVPDGRASFGCATSGNFIYIFGGMCEYKQLTNSLFKLDVTKWMWTKLNPIPTKKGSFPVPRFGHSFTTVDDQIFLFGGVTYFHQIKKDFPEYLNDMFTLDLNGLSWGNPDPIFGTPPSPRESHSMVVLKFHNQDKDEQKILALYGGMNGKRLGDLYFYNVSKCSWSSGNSIEGRIPRPRSMHSACVIGTKMYVFGGWTVNEDFVSNSDSPEGPSSWTCSREFLAFNFRTFSWEFLTNEDESEAYKYPAKRAGHAVVAFNTRFYIFSGRSYDVKANPKVQIYHRDFWCLDILKPNYYPVLQMTKASNKFLDIKWNVILCTDVYVLQLKPKKAPLHTGIRQNSGEKFYFKLYTNPSGKLNLQNVECDPNMADLNWFIAGFFQKNNCTVDGFYSPSDVMVPEEMNSDQVPFTENITKLELQPDTTYEFRICAMNSSGMGPWSPVYEFKTLKNVENAMNNPIAVDISAIPGGINIKWRLATFKKTSDQFYHTVQLLRVNDRGNGNPCFDEVYSGQESECSLSSTWLDSAQYEVGENNKPVVVFRIQSFNSLGLVNSSEVRCFHKPK